MVLHRAASGWSHCTQWIPELVCLFQSIDVCRLLHQAVQEISYLYYRIYFGCIGALVFGDMNFNNKTVQCLALFFFPINPWCTLNLNVNSATIIWYFVKSGDQSKIQSRLELHSCCSDL